MFVRHILRRALYREYMSGAKTGFKRAQAALLCAATAFAALPAQAAPADAQVALVTPLAFIQVENLEFGSIISGTTAGTVTLSPTNVRTATGGVVLKGTGFQTARFAGMGVVTQRVRIRIAPNTITLTGPGPSMTVDSFTIGPGTTLLRTGSSSNYRILPSNGIFWFTVGGRLNVGANQPPGSYSGTFTATLDYQ